MNTEDKCEKSARWRYLIPRVHVQKFQPMRKEEVLNLIKIMSQNEGSAINIGKELFSLTTGITARAALGNKLKDTEVFASFLKESSSSGFGVSDMYISFTKIS